MRGEGGYRSTRAGGGPAGLLVAHGRRMENGEEREEKEAGTDTGARRKHTLVL